jgi:hypothetical protein
VPVTDLDKAGFFPGDERVTDKAWITGKDQDVTGAAVVKISTPGLTQIKLLCIRECRNLIRDRVVWQPVFSLRSS